MNNKHIAYHAMAAGVLALLSACVSFEGIQSQSQLKSIANEGNSGIFAQQQGLWPASDWGVAIGGQELQSLIDAGLNNNNPSLQAASARINAARAVSAAVSANTLPSVNASLDSTYQRFTEHGLIPKPLAGSYESNNQLALNASYELDFWGKHSAEMRTAVSQEKVAEAEKQSARLLLSSAIARSWLQLARQYQQLALSEQQLAVREKIDQLTLQRLKAGLETKSEIQQSLLQISSIKNDIISWKEAIALTRNQLAALLGAGPERGQQIPAPRLQTNMAITAPANLPLELISRRPDIVAARWRVEAGQSEIDLAKNQFYPNINIVGFAGLSSLGLDNFIKSGSSIVGVGPTIRLPIFEGGRLRAQLKNKVAGYDVAVATYNQSLTDALHEVADQLQTLQTSEAQAKQQVIAEQAAKIALQLAQQRQKAGTANMLPVLAAETTLLAQQKLSLDIAIRHTDSQINLIKALGGGYNSKAESIASANSTSNNFTAPNKPEAAQ